MGKFIQVHGLNSQAMMLLNADHITRVFRHVSGGAHIVTTTSDYDTLESYDTVKAMLMNVKEPTDG